MTRYKIIRIQNITIKSTNNFLLWAELFIEEMDHCEWRRRRNEIKSRWRWQEEERWRRREQERRAERERAASGGTMSPHTEFTVGKGKPRPPLFCFRSVCYKSDKGGGASNASQPADGWISVNLPLKFETSQIHAHGSRGASGEERGRMGRGGERGDGRAGEGMVR